jgi:PIN domain nuclease of toxin-antitoxin system
MTPLLLDTCAAIYLTGGEPMARAAIEAMDESSDIVLPLQVSPITAWEVGMLGAKGRFKSSLTPQRWFERLRSTPGIQLCDLTPDVLLASSSLPGKLHRDPADRILAATAREYGFTLVTRDDALLDYGKQGYLSVLKC